MTESTKPVALVTGGAGAFGSAISRRLTADGWAVAVADIDPTRLDAVTDSIPGSLGVVLDVTDEESIRSGVGTIVEHFGRLDGVVNNAGVLPVGDVAATTAETFDRAVALNLRGAFLVTQAAIAHLKASPAGRVVMLGSRTWLSGGNPAYSATKAGLIGLARAVALDLGPTRGTCNVVAPGPVDTPLASVGEEAFARWAAQTLLGRNAVPEDVASAVAFFMSPDAGFITGEILHVAGGLQLAVKL